MEERCADYPVSTIRIQNHSIFPGLRMFIPHRGSHTRELPCVRRNHSLHDSTPRVPVGPVRHRGTLQEDRLSGQSR